jgi:hypothetical protein
MSKDELDARHEALQVVNKMQEVASLLSDLVNGNPLVDAIGTQFLDAHTAASTVVLENPEAYSCMQLAGAARGGRDAESKTEDSVQESKGSAGDGDDDEYVKVSVPNAAALRIALDTETRLPPNRRLFVKKVGEKGRGTIVLRSLSAKPRIVETPHPYENSRDEYHVIEFPSCKGINVTFDPRTKTENGYAWRWGAVPCTRPARALVCVLLPA